MISERSRLVQRRDVVRRDLEELAQQVADGEIDEATAAELNSSYARELEVLEAALKDLPEDLPEPEPERAPVAVKRVSQQATKARSPRRVVIGSLIIVVALSAAIAFAARDATPDEPVAASPGGLTVDPTSVSNEQLEAVVAANPDVNAMRMALADRYFAAEDYGSALDHYLYIAENNPTPPEESKALARIGWMAYGTGLPEAAVEYVESSLAVDPTNDEATLFLGFILLYGVGDAQAAIPHLEEALQIPGLSADIVSQIQEALEDARAGGGS